MKRTTALFVSLLLPLTSAAQGVLLDDIVDAVEPEMPELRQYSVEVIVFAYAEDVHAGTEIFVPDLLPEPELMLDENGFPILEPLDGTPLDGAPRDEETGLPLEEAEPVNVITDDESAPDDPGAEEPVTFTFELMAEDDYALTDTLTRLDELDAYEPLMHFGWIQGMLPDAETEVLALETFAAPPNGLEGEVTLYLSRYLHLVMDLALAAERETSDESGEEPAARDENRYLTNPTVLPVPEEPVPTYTDRRMFGWEDYPAADEPRYAPLKYRISEDRIVRNGELRYYDHPKFGVIARVVRIEAEAEPEEEEGPADDVARAPSVVVQ